MARGGRPLNLAAALVTGLALAFPASAAWQDTRLDQVLSVFAMRPVRALCYAAEEKNSPDHHGAWGYVRRPLGQARVAHLDTLVCEGALALNDPAVPKAMRARSVMVVVHEAYHLRRWGGARDEAQVQCHAVRHWKVAARLLGASEQTVTDLWPYALTLHYELTEFVNIFTGERPYYHEWCAEPPLVNDD